MPTTVEEVKKVIEEGFPNSDVSDIHEENHLITGFIRWDGFKGMEVDDRYNLMLKKVHNRLGYDSLNIGFLVPMAPGDRL